MKNALSLHICDLSFPIRKPRKILKIKLFQLLKRMLPIIIIIIIKPFHLKTTKPSSYMT